VCTCSAVQSSFVEVACICMCTKYHVTRSVDNAIIGVCGDVVEERFHKLFRVYCRLSLSCADGIECYQQLVVNSSCIIQEGPDDFLHALDTIWQQRS
jgi:hypothetical protein